MELGDDQALSGYFTALDIWLSNILRAFSAIYDSPEIMNPISSIPLDDISYNIVVSDENKQGQPPLPVTENSLQIDPPRDCKRNVQVFWSVVAEYSRLTAENWEYNVRHLEANVHPTGSSSTPDMIRTNQTKLTTASYLPLLTFPAIRPLLSLLARDCTRRGISHIYIYPSNHLPIVHRAMTL